MKTFKISYQELLDEPAEVVENNMTIMEVIEEEKKEQEKLQKMKNNG